MAPQDRAFVRRNTLEALRQPAFDPLRAMRAFQQMQHRMSEGGNYAYHRTSDETL